MRNCVVFKNFKKQDVDYTGTFHGFFHHTIEGELYAAAIIERENGDISVEPANCVRLLEEK